MKNKVFSILLFLFIIFSFTSCGMKKNITTIDNDDNELIEQVKDENIPSYWSDYLNSKKQELLNADKSLENNGVSFAFVTDVHIKNNMMITPKLLKYITEKTSIKDVIFGGDLIVENVSDKDIAIDDLVNWKNITSSLQVINVVGNHDGNSNNQLSPSQMLDKSLLYSLLCKDNEDIVHYQKEKLYGYKDNDSQKVRMIFLDTGIPDNTGEPRTGNIDDEQLQWLKNKIEELSSNWTVLVFAHRLFDYHHWESRYTWDENGIKIKSILDEIYDKVDCTIAGIISGHCHSNLHVYSDKGYFMLSTTTDAYKEVNRDGITFEETFDSAIHGVERTVGTISEQAFDLFYLNTNERMLKRIRIGSEDANLVKKFMY